MDAGRFLERLRGMRKPFSVFVGGYKEIFQQAIGKFLKHVVLDYQMAGLLESEKHPAFTAARVVLPKLTSFHVIPLE
jgi:hypothetical protein